MVKHQIFFLLFFFLFCVSFQIQAEDAPDVSRIKVSVSKTKTSIGSKNVKVTAVCYDSEGNTVKANVVWSSKAGPINKGKLHARRTGKFAIIANVGKVKGSKEIEVEADAKKPTKKLKFIFLHHSCGSNLLKDGLRKQLTENNYEVHDATYGTEIAQKTDPKDFVVTFGDMFEKVMTYKLPKGERYDIVAFKSCYPASNIKNDKQLEAYKSYYRTIMKRFKDNPNTLFIPFSPPPLIPARTKPEYAKRARDFANWLKDEYSYISWNVLAFDFYGILADKDNVTSKEYRRNEKDSHPNPVGNKEGVKQFIPLINNAVKSMGW